jgi:WD40 repeat protein
MTRWIVLVALCITLLIASTASLFYVAGNGIETQIVAAVVAETRNFDERRPFLRLVDLDRRVDVMVPRPLPEVTSQVAWYDDQLLIFTAQQVGQDSTHGLHLFDPKAFKTRLIYESRTRDASRIGFNSYNIEISPDGAWLAFIAPSTDTVYVLDLQRRNSELQTVTTLETPVPTLNWSPDGRRLTVTDHSQLLVYDTTTSTAEHYGFEVDTADIDSRAAWANTTHVVMRVNFRWWLVDVTTDEITVPVTGTSDFYLNPRCDRLVYTAYNGARKTGRILDLQSDTVTRLEDLPGMENLRMDDVRLSDTCGHVIVTVDQDPLPFIDMYSIDLEAREAHLLTRTALLTVAETDDQLIYLDANERENILYGAALDGSREPQRLGRIPMPDSYNDPIHFIDEQRFLIRLRSSDNQLSLARLDEIQTYPLTPADERLVDWHLLP